MTEKKIWVSQEDFNFCQGALVAAHDAAEDRVRYLKSEVTALAHGIKDDHSRATEASLRRMERLFARCKADLDNIRACGPGDTMVQLPVKLARNLVHYTMRWAIKMSFHHLDGIAEMFVRVSKSLAEKIKASRPAQLPSAVTTEGTQA